ncbi:MAG TPA: PLP-dependent cysteine synthase family protein [Burkholderiaceae bacterium]|nr:PLP-dependent cysteine synthase family protein [Burkholderiaceae bacterium]
MGTRSLSPRAWCDEAVRRIEADYTRSADTHLLRIDVPGVPHCPLYLKDESVHPTGSLKHRLARSLFLYGLCNGLIGPRTTVVEASSGSTAVSEAYFARLIGVPFVAVMPRTTSREKIALIEFHGGRCHLVDEPGAVYAEAASLARRTGGHYMDQFTYAERATDWRGNNNIAESIFQQMKDEPFPIPAWIVIGAGTGGTSATIGRYVRYRRCETKICLADPENSVFHDYWSDGDAARTLAVASRIEGIGRPRVEPSFNRHVIDHSIRVPDADSFAAARFLERVLGRRVGPSTGTALIACVELMSGMVRNAQAGAVVTLICDGGERYSETCYDDAWLERSGMNCASGMRRLERFWAEGAWSPPARGSSRRRTKATRN